MTKYSSEKIKEVVSLYLEGKTLKEVAALTGVGATTVGRYVKNSGYELRSRANNNSPKKYSEEKETKGYVDSALMKEMEVLAAENKKART